MLMNTMQITAPYFPSTFLSPGRAINTVFTSIWFLDLMRRIYRCYVLVVLSETLAGEFVRHDFSRNLNVAAKHTSLSRLVCVSAHASFTMFRVGCSKKLFYTIFHNTILTAKQTILFWSELIFCVVIAL